MSELFNKYKSLLKSPKLLMICGICGILLIFLSGLGGEDTTKTEGSDNFSFSTAQYREMLEKDIQDMVISITGSKDVTVVITLESSVKYSYADTKEETTASKLEGEEQSSDNELKEGYVTVKTADGGEQALLISTEMPEIRGVAIVCEGGDNEVINEKIQNSVSAALNITSKRIYICGRKTQ